MRVRKTTAVHSKQLFNKRYVKSKKTLKAPDFCGLNKLWEYRGGRKYFWIGIFFTTLFLFIWQMSITIRRYLAYPLSTNTKLVRLDSVYPPSMLLCRFYNRFRTLVWAVDEENITKTDLEEFWIDQGIDPEQTKISAPCDIFAQHFGYPCNRSEFSNAFANHTTVNTLLGQCVDVNFKYQVRQRLFSVNFSVYPTKEQELDDKYNILFHANGELYLNKLFHNTEIPSSESCKIFSFEIKEYKFINSRTNPCQSVHDNIKCWHNCVMQKIEKKLPCGLPFMTESNLTYCDTLKKAYDAHLIIDEIFESGQTSYCDCIRPCRVYEYNVHKEIIEDCQSDHLRILLYIRDSFDEIIEEFYVYPFSSLVSEISGLIGFFLGMAVMTLIELVEYFVMWAIQS